MKLFVEAALSQRDPEEVRTAVWEILSRDEFVGRRSLLERFATWLSKILSLGEGSSDGVARVLMSIAAILAGVLLALLVIQLIRSVREGRGTPSDDSLEVPVDARIRSSQLRRDAAAAGVSGDLRQAMRLYLWSLVVGLGARGDLHYSPAWTNRELLRRGRPSRALRELLEPLVQEFEAKDFGRVPTTSADVSHLAGLCLEYLGPLGGDEKGEAA
ncbi:MAG: hypothetical protein ACI82F_000798 [Planctomycetota bacterium]|jgi:hypothetical protein